MAGKRANYFIVSSIFIAFSIAFLFSYWLGTASQRFMMADIYLYLYMSLLLMVSIVAMMHSLIKCNNDRTVIRASGAHAQTHKNKPRIQMVSTVAKGGLLVFMIGTVLYDTICLVAVFDCIGDFVALHCAVKAQVVTMVYLILKLFFIGCQTMFLMSQSNRYAKYGGSSTNKIVYVINTIVDFAIIAYTILYESKIATDSETDSFIFAYDGHCAAPVDPQNLSFTGMPRTEVSDVMHHIEASDGMNHMEACLNGTSHIFKIALSLEVYMYTYHTEFCILAITLNLIFWNTSCYSSDGRSRTNVSSARTLLINESEHDVRDTCWPTTNEDFQVENSSGEEGSLAQQQACSDLEQVSPGTMNLQEDEELFFTAELEDVRKYISTNYGSIADESAASETMGAVSRDKVSSSRVQIWCANFKNCLKCQEFGADSNRRRVDNSGDCCGFLSFAGFSLIILYTVLCLLQNTNGTKTKDLDIPTNVTSIIVFVVMTVASVVLAIVSTRKLDRGPDIPRTFSVGSICIMLSALLMHVFNFLDVIADCNMLIRENKHGDGHLEGNDLYEYVDVVSVAVDCIHIAMQTKLVLNITWLMKRNWAPDIKSTSISMQCVAFLMVANFSKWILGTAIEMQDPTVNSSQSLYFGKTAWTGVVYTFYPFVVYFRFHCSMALAEYMLWRRSMVKTHKRNSQKRFLSSIGTFTYY